MLYSFFKRHYFLIGISLLCFTYLGFELFYTYFSMLGVDEFWFTHWSYRYKSELPYRDFSPYKTVLGYYFLLVPIMLEHLFSHNFLSPLFFTKNILAILNTFLFLLSAYGLKKIFSPLAVLTTFFFFILSQFVLIYSTNIRVDFIAYWFCLFSAFFLLKKRPILAGTLLALGFLTSQKVLWYLVASNLAIGLMWVIFYRTKKNFLDIVFFNLTFIFFIFIYIIIWSSFSSLELVLHNMFYEAYIMYQLDWYASTRLLFWNTILFFNPLFFLLWPLTCLSLFITFPGDAYRLRFFCVVYTSVIIICLIPYKQIFPYYTLTVLPAFLLNYSAFFAWQYRLFQQRHLIAILYIKTQHLWILLFIYFFGIIYLNSCLNLPIVYSVISLIPLGFGIYIIHSPIKLASLVNPFLPILIWLSLLFLGFIYPFSAMLIQLPYKNGNYQRANLFLANHLLNDHSDYLAGIELFYDKNQPIEGMKHLGSPAIAYLFSPTPKLRKGMLTSLYYSPRATQASVIASIKKSAIKFFINNYRMKALPLPIKKYLLTEYKHFWGSIYLYAPTLSAGTHSQYIKFSGQYKIKSAHAIILDKKKMAPATLIQLKRGYHSFSSFYPFRLILMPENIENKLDPQFQKDEWVRMLG